MRFANIFICFRQQYRSSLSFYFTVILLFPFFASVSDCPVMFVPRHILCNAQNFRTDSSPAAQLIPLKLLNSYLNIYQIGLQCPGFCPFPPRYDYYQSIPCKPLPAICGLPFSKISLLLEYLQPPKVPPDCIFRIH